MFQEKGHVELFQMLLPDHERWLKIGHWISKVEVIEKLDKGSFWENLIRVDSRENERKEEKVKLGNTSLEFCCKGEQQNWMVESWRMIWGQERLITNYSDIYFKFHG